jgi:phosphohistidine swiveling domain-containing protein
MLFNKRYSYFIFIIFSIFSSTNLSAMPTPETLLVHFDIAYLILTLLGSVGAGYYLLDHFLNKNKIKEEQKRKILYASNVILITVISALVLREFLSYGGNRVEKLFSEYRCEINYHAARNKSRETLNIFLSKFTQYTGYNVFKENFLKSRNILAYDLRPNFWHRHSFIHYKNKPDFLNVYYGEFFQKIKEDSERVDAKSMDLFLVDHRTEFFMYFEAEEQKLLIQFFEKFKSVSFLNIDFSRFEEFKDDLYSRDENGKIKKITDFKRPIDEHWPLVGENFISYSAFPDSIKYFEKILSAQDVKGLLEEGDLYIIAPYSSFYRDGDSYHDIFMDYIQETVPEENILFFDFNDPDIRKNLNAAVSTIIGKKFLCLGLSKFDCTHYGMDVVDYVMTTDRKLRKISSISQIERTPTTFLGYSNQIAEVATYVGLSKKSFFHDKIMFLDNIYFQMYQNYQSLLAQYFSIRRVGDLELSIFVIAILFMINLIFIKTYRFKFNEIKNNGFYEIIQGYGKRGDQVLAYVKSYKKNILPRLLSFFKIIIIAFFFHYFYKLHANEEFFLFYSHVKTSFVLSLLFAIKRRFSWIVDDRKYIFSFSRSKKKVDFLKDIFCFVLTLPIFLSLPVYAHFFIFCSFSLDIFFEYVLFKFLYPIKSHYHFSSLENAGQKSLNLEILSEFHNTLYKVPDFLVLESKYYEQFLNDEKCKVDKETLGNIFKKLKTKKVAIRSNSLYEDAVSSRAGLYHSALNVSKSDFNNQLRDVFFKAKDLGDKKFLPIIQEMKNFSVSGVLFSSHYNNPFVLRIELVNGHLQNMLHGESSCYFIEVGKYGHDFHCSPEIEDFMSKREMRKLVDHLLCISLFYEKTFNSSVDIEWGVEKETNDLILLQIRKAKVMKGDEIEENEKINLMNDINHFFPKTSLSMVKFQKLEMDFKNNPSSLVKSYYEVFYNIYAYRESGKFLKSFNIDFILRSAKLVSFWGKLWFISAESNLFDKIKISILSSYYKKNIIRKIPIVMETVSNKLKNLQVDLDEKLKNESFVITDPCMFFDKEIKVLIHYYFAEYFYLSVVLKIFKMLKINTASVNSITPSRDLLQDILSYKKDHMGFEQLYDKWKHRKLYEYDFYEEDFKDFISHFKTTKELLPPTYLTMLDYSIELLKDLHLKFIFIVNKRIGYLAELLGVTYEEISYLRLDQMEDFFSGISSGDKSHKNFISELINSCKKQNDVFKNEEGPTLENFLDVERLKNCSFDNITLRENYPSIQGKMISHRREVTGMLVTLDMLDSMNEKENDENKIHSSVEIDQEENHKILLYKNLDLRLYSYLPQVTSLIVHEVNELSHMAILVRELGIIVVQVSKENFQKLESGDLVHIYSNGIIQYERMKSKLLLENSSFLSRDMSCHQHEEHSLQ